MKMTCPLVLVGIIQVMFKNLDIMYKPSQNHLWALLTELLLSLFWSYAMLVITLVWLVGKIFTLPTVMVLYSPVLPEGTSTLLISTCLLQFILSKWLDSHYDKGLGKNYYWMIWYPIVFWLISICTTIWALPKVLFRKNEKRARWVSPDRGVHQINNKKI